MAVVFVGMDKILSCGYSRCAEREISVWDIRNFTQLQTKVIDYSAGLLKPLYDEDTGILFLGGTGDGSIRFYEIVDDSEVVHYLSEVKFNTPQRDICLLPKRTVNTSICEVARILRAIPRTVVPVSFCVPVSMVDLI